MPLPRSIPSADLANPYPIDIIPDPESPESPTDGDAAYPSSLLGNGTSLAPLPELRRPKSRRGLAQSRSASFGDGYGYGGDALDAGHAQDQLRNEAVVLAEVSTNVVVENEFDFMSSLTNQLSVRYQRTAASIAVTLHHGISMMLGGTFEPTYTMVIHGLPSETALTKNKKNAALIQRHVERALRVSPARGFLRFVAVPEGNFAVRGRTMATHLSEAVAGFDAYQHRHGGDVPPVPPIPQLRNGMRVKSLSSLKMATDHTSQPAVLSRTRDAVDRVEGEFMGHAMSTVAEENEDAVSVGSSEGGKPPRRETPAAGAAAEEGEPAQAEGKKNKVPLLSKRKSFAALLFNRSPKAAREDSPSEESGQQGSGGKK